MLTATKQQFLKDAGYAYNFDREIYVNRKVRRAISLEAVEDHSEEDLRTYLSRPASPSGKWDIIFTDVEKGPPPAVERELSAFLG